MKHSYDELMSIIADVESDNAFEGMSETLKGRIYSVLHQKPLELKYGPDVLPETRLNFGGLTSKAIIFMVDGITYYGHYHKNGFFYVDVRLGAIPFTMARHPKTKSTPFGEQSLDHVPIISSWEYA